MCIVYELHCVCGVECYPISKHFQVKADNHVSQNLAHVITYYGTHLGLLTFLSLLSSSRWPVLLLEESRRWERDCVFRFVALLMVSMIRGINKPHPLDSTGCTAHAHWIALALIDNKCAQCKRCTIKERGRGLSHCTFVYADLVKVLSN